MSLSGMKQNISDDENYDGDENDNRDEKDGSEQSGVAGVCTSSRDRLTMIDNPSSHAAAADDDDDGDDDDYDDDDDGDDDGNDDYGDDEDNETCQRDHQQTWLYQLAPVLEDAFHRPD